MYGSFFIEQSLWETLYQVCTIRKDYWTMDIWSVVSTHKEKLSDIKHET